MFTSPPRRARRCTTRPAAASLDGIIRPDEQALGLAYDFNTDHLLCVSPRSSASSSGLLENPARAAVQVALHTSAPADLAIRSSDRHLFAVHPDGRSVVELTLAGGFVRRLEFTGLAGRSADSRMTSAVTGCLF